METESRIWSCCFNSTQWGSPPGETLPDFFPFVLSPVVEIGAKCIFWRLLVWILYHPCLCFAELLKPWKSSGLMAAYVGGGGGRRNNHAQQHTGRQVCDCPCSIRLCFHSLSTCNLLPKARQKAELTRALRCTREGFL